MSERAVDAFLMGVCAAIVAWPVLAPLGVVPQVAGTYLVARVVALVVARAVA